MAAHVQQPAPQFSCEALVNGEFKDVSLSDYKGKYVVLFFYPLDFTFVCPTEIIAFNDRIAEFTQVGAEVARRHRWTASSPTWPGRNTPRKEGGLGELDLSRCSPT